MGKNVKQTLKELTKDIDTDLAAFQLSYLRELKAATPVQTGAAQKAWRKVKKLKLGTNGAMITNKVGYAGLLDKGSSNKSP